MIHDIYFTLLMFNHHRSLWTLCDIIGVLSLLACALHGDLLSVIEFEVFVTQQQSEVYALRRR